MFEERAKPVHTLPDWLAQHAERRPAQVAIESAEGTLTYEALFEDVSRCAASLRRAGIRPDLRVAVMVKSNVTYARLMHALMQLDAVLVPLNWRLTAAELAQQTADCQAVMLLFDDGCQALAEHIARIYHFDLGAVHSDDIRTDQGRVAREHVELTRPHAIIYTSGTTGAAKGAVISYQNHWWGAMASAMQLGLDVHDKWLVPMPLFHVGGLAVLMRSLIYGTTVVLHDGFDEYAVNQALDESNITLVSVVPVMLQRMLERRQTAYPSTLRTVLLGGSAAPKALLEQAYALGVPVNQSYGMTETNTQATTLQSVDALRKIGSSGKPLGNTRIAIVGPDGLTMAPQIEGEIAVSGPTVIAGYFNRPDANAKSFRDGWFYTGDIGVLDDEGYLYVLDRRADLIVSGGENVYPAEVESVLMQCESVLEAGVVGKPDETWGQVPVAFVVLRQDLAVTAEALRDACRIRLAGYKVPTAFYFVDALPRNASGKLLRRALREKVTS